MISSTSEQRDPTDRCPSRDVLLRFLDDTLPSNETTVILNHLDGCGTCSAVLEQTVASSEWESQLRALVAAPPLRFADAPAKGMLPVELTAALPQSRFHRLELIGRGGCANVYRAEDSALGRTVALKLPHASLFGEPGANRRFLTELRATAALHHPHIVALFDAGVDEHQGFIVFEHVPGPTLAEWIDAQVAPIDFRTAATIVARLADGVHHAHNTGILHRDLKPSNVLLDTTRQGDELPFTPRIADFGIARFLNSDLTHTLNETVLGSPPFMSPEQALGDRSKIGPASDVYALGGILYQLVTRRLPISGTSAADTLRRVLTDEPVPPRRYRSNVPRDLEAICLKCLAKEPQQRYASARDLEQDLERFLADEPVSARSPSIGERAIGAVRKHPARSAVVGTFAALVIAVMALLSRHSAVVGKLARELSTKNTQLTKSNARLETALDEAKLARDDARETLYAFDVRRAFRGVATGDARLVHTLVNRYADAGKLAAYRGIEWNYLALRTQPKSREIFAGKQAIYFVRLSPDKKSLAVVGQDATIRLFDIVTGEPLAAWPSEQREVNGACFSADGETLWTAGDDGTIKRWKIKSRELVYAIEAHTPEMAFEVVYDRRRDRIVTCGAEKTLRVWNASTGEPAGVLEGHSAKIDAIWLSRDGATVGSSSPDRTIRTWNLDSLTPAETYLVPREYKNTFAATTPLGHYIVAAASSTSLLMFNRGKPRLDSFSHTVDEPMRICFSDEDRPRMFVGDREGAITQWTVPKSTAKNKNWTRTALAWLAHGERISHLEWSPVTNELISASRDGRVRAWSVLENDDRLTRRIEHPDLRHFAVVPGEHRVLSASNDGLIFDSIADGDRTRHNRVVDRGSAWASVDFTPDGRLFAAGGNDGCVAIWRREAVRPHVKVPAFAGETVDVRFSPDGRHVVAMAKRAAQALSIDSQTGAIEPLSLPFAASHVYFEPGANVFAASYENSLWVYDAASRQVRYKLANPWTSALLVRIFPDGRTLAVADERKIRLHDARDGRLIRELLGHNGDVTGLTISNDGRTLVSTSGFGGFVRFIHVATGQWLGEIPVARRGAIPCEFTDDNRWLIVGHDRDAIVAERMR